MFPSSSRFPSSLSFPFFFRAGRSILVKKKRKKSPAFIPLVSPPEERHIFSSTMTDSEKKIKKRNVKGDNK